MIATSLSLAKSISTRRNPYVGPGPFEPEDEPYFFGREQEIADLRNVLIAERIVLLYSPSGAGKTSLMQAGLIPRLKQDGFHVLGPIRVNLDPQFAIQQGAHVKNRYVFSLLFSLEQSLPKEQRT